MSQVNDIEVVTVTGADTFSAVYNKAYDEWVLPHFQALAIAATACEMYGADVDVALANLWPTIKFEWDYNTRGIGWRWNSFYGSRPIVFGRTRGRW